MIEWCRSPASASLRVAAGLSSLVLLAAAALPAAAATTTVSDNTFADANWTLTQFTSGNGGSAVGLQVSQSGNFLRSIADTVITAAPATTSTIYSTSIYTPFTYSPGVSGAITSVDYAENAICLSGCFGQGQSTGAAILQNGQLYITTAFLITGPGTTFQPLSLTGLTAASFSLLNPVQGNCCDNTQHPDFSASGAPMQVGFYRANGTSPGGGGYTLTAGIDDWVVTLNSGAPAPAAVIPTLSAPMLAFTAALIVLVLLVMRRRVAR